MAYGAGSPQSTWRPPTSVDQIPFINGAVEIPSHPGSPNNRGVLNDTTLPGMTHIEFGIDWMLMEPEKDVWNVSELDEMFALAKKHNLKVAVLPSVTTPPEWVRHTAGYVPEMNASTGVPVQVFSPWAPGTYEAYDHIYSYLATHYGDRIDFVKFPMEVGMLVGDNPSGLLDDRVFWCGDRYARADYRDRMVAKYGTLAHLNTAWGTNFATPDEIAYPDVANRASQERRWVDFVTWYRDSATRGTVQLLKVMRKNFPTQPINIPMGYGSDNARDGCDRTGAVKAAAAFMPVIIRSTHSGFNRDQYPQAYWFYKRMEPTATRLGLGFGTEPPGGDFKYSEMRRELFDAASANVNFVFQYYQNYHVTMVKGDTPRVIDDYKNVLRPFEKSQVGIGILFPTTQMMLDLKGHPDGQLQFCSEARSHIDYDLVDENMIGWGDLAHYKVLIHTSGTIYAQGVLPAIAKWIAGGGLLVCRGAPDWRVVGEPSGANATWTSREDPMAEQRLAGKGVAGVQVYRLGKGTIFAAASSTVSAYVSQAVGVLSVLPGPIPGFKAEDAGTWATDFPDGRLLYDPKTQDTMFVKK